MVVLSVPLFSRNGRNAVTWEVAVSALPELTKKLLLLPVCVEADRLAVMVNEPVFCMVMVCKRAPLVKVAVVPPPEEIVAPGMVITVVAPAPLKSVTVLFQASSAVILISIGTPAT